MSGSLFGPRGLTSEKRARLADFLATLPNAAAAQLFAALERDRSIGREDLLPHDALLDDLRAQLAARDASFPNRPPTARRAFFAPFEDFFVAARAERKRRGRIARASLNSIWGYILASPEMRATAGAAAALDRAFASGENGEAETEALFAAAREDLGRFLASLEAEPDLRRRLAVELGAEGAHDFLELATLAPYTERLEEMRRALPRPLCTLTEEQIYLARSLYARASEEAQGIAPYLLILIIGRMERPGKALALHYHFLKARDLARHDAGVVADALFEDLEAAARGLERDSELEISADFSAMRFREFASFAADLATEARRAGDAVILARVEASRGVAADALARLCERALSALRVALPHRPSGGARLVAPRPDFAAQLSRAQEDAAREAAELLAQAPDLAGVIETSRRDAREMAAQAEEEARRYVADLAVEIRAASGAELYSARQAMERTLTLAAPLLNDEPERAATA